MRTARPSLLRSAVLGALLSASTTAWAGPLRQPVLDQLAGVESPPTAESLGKLGAPGAIADELIALSQDTTLPHSQRLRALHALGWFPSDTTRPVLVAALDGGDEHAARKAAWALGNGWKDAALPELTRALAADDAQLRIAAAKSLGAVGSDGAKAVLQARLDAEADAEIKGTIQAALTAPAAPQPHGHLRR